MISQGQVLIREEKENRSDSWMVDSACTAHIYKERYFFKGVLSEKGNVQVGKKSLISAEGYCLVEFNTVLKGRNIFISLEDVLYMPNTVHNLISSSRASRKGFKTVIYCCNEN